MVKAVNARQQLSKATIMTSYKVVFLQEVNPTKQKLMSEAPIITPRKWHSNTSVHVQQSFMKSRDTRKFSVLWMCWINADVHDRAGTYCARLTTRLF